MRFFVIFTHLKRKFTFNQDLQQQNIAFNIEFLSLGHMENMPEYENASVRDSFSCLLRHGFLKENSTTAKLRVAFHASGTIAIGVLSNKNPMIAKIYEKTSFKMT